MKIWLDTTRQSDDDLKQDCEKDCPDILRRNPEDYFLQTMETFQLEQLKKHLYTCYLEQTQPLFLQSYGDAYTLACCTTGAGILLVMDAQASALLQSFQQARTLHSVISQNRELTVVQIETAVSYFYRYGLLRDVSSPFRLPPDGESDTLAVWLHVTNACNLRCDYCYIEKTTEHMQADTGKEAIDATIRSARLHGFRQVRLQYSGGEASLQADNVIALHDYAVAQMQQHDLVLNAYLMSNGMYLSTRTIEQLKSRNIGVMISLDGVGAYHDQQRAKTNGRGSFTRVDKTISRLLEYGLRPSIAITITARNIAGIPELLRYLFARELTFSLNYYRENRLSNDLADLYFSDEDMIAGMRVAFAMISESLPRYSLLGSLIDKATLKATHSHTCGVGRNFMVINQQGQVAKCQVAMQHTVATVATDDPLHFIRADHDGVQGLSVDEKEGCQSCTWRYWCAGGCPALTYRMTGRYDVKSPYCSIYLALFPDVLGLEAQRLLTYIDPIEF